MTTTTLHEPGTVNTAPEEARPGDAAPEPPAPREPGAHEVVRFVRALDTALDRVVANPVWSMSEPEQCEALRALYRAESRLAGLRLRVLAGADRNQIGADSGLRRLRRGWRTRPV